MQYLWMISLVFIMASFQIAFAEEYSVTIPFGAYDPTFETPVNYWYEPPVISIQEGDTVTWLNEDREGHTVTSGEGSGRFGWMSGSKFGERTDLFDSGRFHNGETWSHTFEKAGLYTYYCTIHPWMEGAVSVGKSIPEFPHDAKGNKIEEFPIIEYTPDGLIELDMTWEPNVIMTNEKTTFIYQTYDPLSNTNLDKMRYDLIIQQNGKVVFQDEGLTGVGGDYRNVVFKEPGPIQIIFENIESAGTSGISSQARSPMTDPSSRMIVFTAVVYDSFEENVPDQAMAQPARRVELQYEILILVIVIPGGLAVVSVLYMMYGKDKKKKGTSNTKSSPV